MDLIKLGHTLFALPFALSALAIAYAKGARFSLADLLWIVLAFTAARSAAMGFNRVADLKFDALNPRTEARPISAGLISKSSAMFFVGLSALVFIFAAYMLNDLCFYLSFPALAFLFFYSYAKRFTALAHYILGAALALAPLGAWIAVTGGLEIGIMALAFALFFQIAGFDILYSLQDMDFDVKHKLFSIPARYGKGAAVFLASLSLLISAAFLFLTGFAFDLNAFFYAGACAVSIIYISAICVMLKCGIAKIDLVFFKMNAAASAIVLAAAAAASI